MELLSHPAASVRKGASRGIGGTADAGLIKTLINLRAASRASLFRHAAYRTIDNLLTAVEAGGDKKDLRALSELLRQPPAERRCAERTARSCWHP
ncbi:MAG: hypothetical protein GY862_31120 [Gammaproteobacteria bacterium]|nr:hypothetical protein [Gammaproteobacteria bacterium]